MPSTALRDGRARRGDVRLVLLAQAVAASLVAGWFLTGHASAPDDGLLQIDVLALHERVSGVGAVDGRPTMLVLTGTPGAACIGEVQYAQDHPLDPEFRRLVVSDPALADRLALPAAAQRCQPGYALVDAADRVRYRSYDPGWAHHAQEQQTLLARLR